VLQRRQNGSRYQLNRKWKQIPADCLHETLAKIVTSLACVAKDVT
jgi:hypothetical protein